MKVVYIFISLRTLQTAGLSNMRKLASDVVKRDSEKENRDKSSAEPRFL